VVLPAEPLAGFYHGEAGCETLKPLLKPLPDEQINFLRQILKAE